MSNHEDDDTLSAKRPRLEDRNGEPHQNNDGTAVVATTMQFNQEYHRWLYHNIQSYKNLRDEVAAGWQTEALDKRFKEAHDFHKKEAEVDAEGRRISMLKKVRGYCQWSSTTLAGAAPDVFQKFTLNGGDHQKSRPLFLDIGSAPGGMSQFLHQELGWQGISTSLGEDKGGMPMMYRPDREDPKGEGEKLNGNGTAVAPVKKPVSASAKLMSMMKKKKPAAAAAPASAPAASSATTTTSSSSSPHPFKFVPMDIIFDVQQLEAKLFPGDTSNADLEKDTNILAPFFAEKRNDASGTRQTFECNCDFAIAGAVQDQTQREGGVEAATAPAVSVAATSSSSLPPLDALFRSRMVFTFSQLYVALRAIKTGGSVMLVYGPSDCASLLSFTQEILSAVVPPPSSTSGGENTGTSALKNVRILPTMHVEKSPVYILLTNVFAEGSPIWKDVKQDGDVVAVQLRQRALDALAARMHMTRTVWSKEKKVGESDDQVSFKWNTDLDYNRWILSLPTTPAVESNTTTKHEQFAKEYNKETLQTFRTFLEDDLSRVWMLRTEKLRNTRLSAVKKFH